MFKRQKYFFLLLSILTGILILSPNLNFLYYLAPGDHGRDLYSFKKTYEGALPYKDYSSWHGPLMPYYYSLFYRIFGVSIQSTLLGYNLLALLIGIFIYLACATFLRPGISFLSAVWYWAFRYNEFFYTFNHIGAVFFMTTVIYCLFQYIKQPKKSYIYWGTLSIICVALVRPNIGLADLAAFYVSLAITQIVNRRWNLPKIIREYLPLAALAMLISIFIYWLFVRKTYPAIFSKELAYWQAAHFGNIPANLLELKTTLLIIFNTSWLGRGFAFFLVLVTGSTSFYLAKTTKDLQEQKNLALVILALFLFIMGNFMECLLGTRWFRWIWILVPSIMLMFFLIEIGLRPLHSIIKRLVYAFLGILIILAVFENTLSIQKSKVRANHLQIGNNAIYLAAFQQENIATFRQTTEFLVTHVPPDEKIVAIPYEPIYYFFSGRDSALRDLKFFNNSGNLRLLEDYKINYIVLSNRATHNAEYPDQVLGKTYGVDLSKYLDENFEVVATFGPWGRPAAWISNHAVKIYKRLENKKPLKN